MRWSNGRHRGVNRFLQRLNRYTAYLLIPIVFFMLLTGFRMTGSFIFIPRGLADLLHRIYIHAIFLLLFTVHSLLSLRIMFMRKNIGGRLLDVIFILIGFGLFVFFTYLSLKLILPI